MVGDKNRDRPLGEGSGRLDEIQSKGIQVALLLLIK